MRNNMQQFKNLSSWREDTLIVEGKSVGTLDFFDTTPNHFIMQNPNDCIVYIGISKTPNEKNYEFRVTNNSNDVFGRPTPTRKMMVYNPSDKTIVLKVFSIHKEFELLTLKNMSALIENATVITDDIIKGFAENVMLPYGTNHIGEVDLKDYSNDMEDIHTIGKVVIPTYEGEEEPKTIGAVKVLNTFDATEILSKLESLFNQIKSIPTSYRIRGYKSYNTSSAHPPLEIPYIYNYNCDLVISYYPSDDVTEKDLIINIQSVTSGTYSGTTPNNTYELFRFKSTDILDNFRIDISNTRSSWGIKPVLILPDELLSVNGSAYIEVTKKGSI